MRTLLIDNYDSFTYNLFHQLTEVNGREPEVVRNDDPAWRPDLLAGFDNVVISPGPGTPHRAADLGISREVVARARLPLLGVCLGHQAIGLLHGAEVHRAPEPRHGRTSPVLHSGTGLFRGVPSPMEAVRYHSLAVSELPPDLEATAWTPDGVLMGLRHRMRPMWGIQFHPESICTRDGTQLLRNFAELSLQRRVHHPLRGRRPGAARPARPAAGPPARRLRVLVEQVPTGWTDEAAYAVLFNGGDHAFWLDSSRPDERRGRFSVMGDASGPLGRVATADVSSGTVNVRSAAGTGMSAGPFLDWLQRDLDGIRTQVPPLPFDFALGWVGYLGYELKAECGGDAVHRSPDPDATMVFADRAVVLDHATGTTYLLAAAEDGAEGSAEAAHAWLGRARERLEREAAGRPPEAAAPETDAPEADAPEAEVVLRHDRAAYLALIEACQEEIAAGETYEVCITNMAEVRGRYDPWRSYLRLRRDHPAPFAALLQFGGLNVLSTSPERFLRVGADGVIESEPIKGTRPRGADAEEDSALVASLRTDEKDRAENLMIVDLARNDLGRCAVPGSVEAESIFRVESYATVHQLVSTVRARLRPGLDAVDCVRAAFPGGSMTGAPKVRTMKIIDRLEGGARGVYSGTIGYLSLTGAADLSMVIRTALVTEDRVRYGVGGAVIALSDPAAEFEETAVKAAPLLHLTGAAFPEREQDGATL
ncbi:aminodeoxychorismate synthase component I [Kitasatospora sp. SUK 42]|uniref:aminodeoxychorismate synthase component I n=1 Tax=Kitasatospora sp. SUK 42 TaxID=1588882 RepID=UPI0018CA759E|nr:aminodeoxychorismate synthase component I [Kitasatospora sp. SUK 42]MBV2155115.1 aminodeoxychorismate synthase component I [Kitasatospora sp. SUK 42]